MSKRKVAIMTWKMSKLAEKSRNSQALQRVFIVCPMCSFLKQLDSVLMCVFSVIDHRRRQNLARTTVWHSPAARVLLTTFRRHLRSRTDARKKGISLL